MTKEQIAAMPQPFAPAVPANLLDEKDRVAVYADIERRNPYSFAKTLRMAMRNVMRENGKSELLDWINSKTV